MNQPTRRDPKIVGPIPSTALRWAVFGLVVSLLLMGIKTVGYLVTGSAAVLADALESSIHIVTSGFALFAVWLSSRPGDQNHPYGHGKVEYLSAALEGFLVLLTGAAIVGVGVKRLIAPVELPAIAVGAAVELVAALIALAAGTALVRAGRRIDSPTIEADGVHIRSDAMTSFGGMFGVLMVAATGQVWIDSVVAIFLGLFLFYSGGGVIRTAVGGLMDEANPELMKEIATTMAEVRAEGWITPHAAKVHRLGQAFHLDLHLVFPRYWRLDEAHTASHEMQDSLRAKFDDRVEVMIHNEPCIDSNCQFC
ncbi:MAG: cation diffusion facilitator family transporter, partial [Bradymonadia bacterium]